MTSLVEIIRHHIAYDAWASDRLLDASEKLTPEQLDHDFGSADKSVRGTLVHIFRSSRMWLWRIAGGTQPAPKSTPEDEDLPSLRPKFTALQGQWKDWGDSLNEDDGTRVLDYSDLKGNPHAQPIWQLVFQVVNHGTHHRGQVSGFLRASGQAPPSIDFIAFVRQNAK